MDERINEQVENLEDLHLMVHCRGNRAKLYEVERGTKVCPACGSNVNDGQHEIVILNS